MANVFSICNDCIHKNVCRKNIELYVCDDTTNICHDHMQHKDFSKELSNAYKNGYQAGLREGERQFGRR